MKVKVKTWHTVASWTWGASDDACGICRMVRIQTQTHTQTQRRQCNLKNESFTLTNRFQYLIYSCDS